MIVRLLNMECYHFHTQVDIEKMRRAEKALLGKNRYTWGPFSTLITFLEHKQSNLLYVWSTCKNVFVWSGLANMFLYIILCKALYVETGVHTEMLASLL